MSKEAASADLQAAAYWKNVARSDREEIGAAATKVSELTKAARREEERQSDGTRRTRSLSAG
jgi:hypothetical protein